MSSFASDSTNPFVRASENAREAISQAEETRESARATRLRLKLRSLIVTWRSARRDHAGSQGERLRQVLGAVIDETAADMGNIQLSQGAPPGLQIRVQIGCPSSLLELFGAVHRSDGAGDAAFRAGRTVVVDDVAASPLFTPLARRTLLEVGVLAMQSAALVKAGRKLGVISVHYRKAGIPRRRQEAFRELAPEISEAVSLCIESEGKTPEPVRADDTLGRGRLNRPF